MLHAKLSKLLATLGKNLELYLTALDPTDEVSRPEHDAYTSLMKQHRDLAARLRATADEMTSYRNLPMANHDEEALSGQPVIDAFREMLTAQEELQALLQDWTEEYRAMLAEEEDSDQCLSSSSELLFSSSTHPTTRSYVVEGAPAG